jgi:23S rRNA pseudouridine1911/1915/1917 synthase
MTKFKFTVKINKEPITMFEYLKYSSGISTRLFNKFKRSATFFINEQERNVTSLVSNGEVIEIELCEDRGDVEPEYIPFDIIYEDSYLLAVNKPVGIVVHPTCSQPFGTLANGVAFYLQSQNLNIPVRPVIRLDRDTSGLIIFAKNAFVQQSLINEMQRNNVTKTYLAIVEGAPIPLESSINAPIARLPGSIISRHVSDGGAAAITDYKTLQKHSYYSLLEVKPKTGRTHQIRVHMQYIGHPIIGDTLYGNASEFIGRQALHALRYEFPHPETKEWISLECPVPEDMNRLMLL